VNKHGGVRELETNSKTKTLRLAANELVNHKLTKCLTSNTQQLNEIAS